MSRKACAAVRPIADDAAALFYRRLFELDPSLERMFKGDMAEQRRKLMQMLTAAPRGQERLAAVSDAAAARGPGGALASFRSSSYTGRS